MGKSSIFITIFIISIFCLTGNSNPTVIGFHFSTVERNGLTLQGASFGSIPQADVAFGDIPTSNAFVGATDGKGAIINADPSEGVMMFAPEIETAQAAFMWFNVSVSHADAAITLASIDQGPDVFVNTSSPGNASTFVNNYGRITTLYTPASLGFQPVFQIVNNSETLPLTVYVDHWEIYTFQEGEYVNTEFLSGAQAGVFSFTLGECFGLNDTCTDGNFTIDIPPSINLSEYTHISVWCVPVGVSFGHGRFMPGAEPSPPPTPLPSAIQPGWVADFGTGNEHAVAGKVRVVDEDTLQFENFEYDGNGIEVELYLIQTDIERFVSSEGRAGVTAFKFPIGVCYGLNASCADGNFTLDIPSSINLLDYTHISVWCVPVGVSLGDGKFKPENL